MHRELMSEYGEISPKVKPAIFRSLYRELTGDHLSSTNKHESEIDSRVYQVIKLEDVDILMDL